jgi:hypothetical protein
MQNDISKVLDGMSTSQLYEIMVQMKVSFYIIILYTLYYPSIHSILSFYPIILYYHPILPFYTTTLYYLNQYRY